MSTDDKLDQLFQAAVQGQERLEKQAGDDDESTANPMEIEVEPEGDAASAGEEVLGEEILIEQAEPAEPAEQPPAKEPEPAKRTAQDAITEALIQAKQEATKALEQTQKEAKSMHERLLRVSADFDNFRKRSRKQQESAVKFANENMLRELLPVLDNFDRALEHVGDHSDNPVVQGIQMVSQTLFDTLDKLGLKGFSAQGLAFDPNVHEAVEQVPTEEHPAGSIVREYQKGYLLHERLLRPSRVAVAMPVVAPKPETDAATPEATNESAGTDATETAQGPEAVEPDKTSADAKDNSGGEAVDDGQGEPVATDNSES